MVEFRLKSNMRGEDLVSKIQTVLEEYTTTGKVHNGFGIVLKEGKNYGYSISKKFYYELDNTNVNKIETDVKLYFWMKNRATSEVAKVEIDPRKIYSELKINCFDSYGTDREQVFFTSDSNLLLDKLSKAIAIAALNYTNSSCINSESECKK